MKLKRFNENNNYVYIDPHIKSNINVSKDYGIFFYELLIRFFENKDMSHTELIKDDNSDDFILVCEFNSDYLNSKIFRDIANYLDFINNYGGVEIHVNDDRLSLEARIFESKFGDLDPKLKMIYSTNKYNI